jgi:hypothetical protein
MKTQGFEARFSQNLAPVGARKATKPLPCLHFTFIQPALFRDFRQFMPIFLIFALSKINYARTLLNLVIKN